ncbi:hypothetical protein [Oryzobacter telluris]|uniref:hypothetical protein n=1 Tax=Oryzobacter telluris TaxID=3149179 RepID=UPI00370D3ED1
MPTPRIPLPGGLLTGPFTVAQARELYLARGRLRGSDLATPTRGVRRPACDEVDHLAHAQAFAAALPVDSAFSHATAARLHGLPTPAPWSGVAEELDVMRDSRSPRIQRSGCRHHRGLERRSVVELSGLRVTSATDTWCDLADRWDHADLLAAADVLLRRQHATPEVLVAAAAARTGRRGAGSLRTVAGLARPGSASPGETLARHWFWAWGLPEPELNVAVLDAHGGWLATCDFVWRRQRVVGEYDGDVHRTDRRTWQRDRERRASLEDDGWAYVEMTSLCFSDDDRRAALRRRLARLLLA